MGIARLGNAEWLHFAQLLSFSKPGWGSLFRHCWARCSLQTPCGKPPTAKMQTPPRHSGVTLCSGSAPGAKAPLWPHTHWPLCLVSLRRGDAHLNFWGVTQREKSQLGLADSIPQGICWKITVPRGNSAGITGLNLIFSALCPHGCGLQWGWVNVPNLNPQVYRWYLPLQPS